MVNRREVKNLCLNIKYQIAGPSYRHPGQCQQTGFALGRGTSAETAEISLEKQPLPFLPLVSCAQTGTAVERKALSQGSIPGATEDPGSCARLCPCSQLSPSLLPSPCCGSEMPPGTAPCPAGPRFREPCQRSPTAPAAIHSHKHRVFHLRNTFSSQRYTARFSKLELWDQEISLVMAAATEYKCVSFPESNSAPAKENFCWCVCLFIPLSPSFFSVLFAQQNRVLLNKMILYNIMCYNKQSANKNIFALRDHFQIV